ncbi:MAG: hypothetical protein LBM75_07335 [Myxococcales bacterium]|jgi:hypothetical protein|nr:hypothetical protein [Myxococcales bacterium]
MNQKMRLTLLVALAAVMISFPAHANYWNEDMSGSWAMSGAGGDDGMLLSVELGYPDIAKVNFWKIGNSSDFGAFFNFTDQMFDYGENGIQFGANMRFKLMEKDSWDLSLRVSPGLEMYFWGYGAYDETAFGLLVDLRLLAGIQIVPRFRVHAGIAMPIEIIIASTEDHGDDALWPWFAFPVQINGGAEFKITPKISVLADLRFGPAFKFGDYVDANDWDWRDDESDMDSGAWFDYRVTVGAAFRF